MLDYSRSGTYGEAQIVHVETECDPIQIMFLAADFTSFINGLVSGSIYAAEV